MLPVLLLNPLLPHITTLAPQLPHFQCLPYLSHTPYSYCYVTLNVIATHSQKH